MSHFTGKRIIITGASSGIGAQLARQFAAEGARLALAARREAELRQVADECKVLGGEAIVIPTDVTKNDECANLVAQTVEAFGGLDMLVNNAGRSMHALFQDINDLAIFEELIHINYLGSVACTHFALPHLLASSGQIVVVSSLTGKAGIPTRTGYSASKHALHGFFDGLRAELIGQGVTITMVCPGFVDTDIRRFNVGKFSDVDKKGMMSVEECATIIIKAARKRKREVIMTGTGRIGQYIRPFFPGLIDRIARKKVGL